MAARGNMACNPRRCMSWERLAERPAAASAAAAPSSPFPWPYSLGQRQLVARSQSHYTRHLLIHFSDDDPRPDPVKAAALPGWWQLDYSGRTEYYTVQAGNQPLAETSSNQGAKPAVPFPRSARRTGSWIRLARSPLPGGKPARWKYGRLLPVVVSPARLTEPFQEFSPSSFSRHSRHHGYRAATG